MVLVLDYIDDDNTAPSGYRTGGVTEGEGDVDLGNVADVVNVKTSLSENFNTFGCVLTTNSPPTDANYSPSASCPNWIYDVWYEVTVKLSAFGAAGFGSPSIVEVHASPSKTGNNTEEVVPGPCPVVCVNPPNAGTNQVFGCDANNQPPTSFDLVDAQAGQKWKIVSVPAGANISVTTPAGIVTGTIVSGNYKFRLQTQSDSLNCFDEVTIIVQCGPGGGDEICYVSPTKPQQVSAKQEWKINPDQTVTIRTTFAKTFVDNTYGTNAIGWPGGHSFGNLVGSDKLELSLLDANGVEKMYLVLDYIEKDQPTPSTFGTGGVTDGEGKVEEGNEADVVNVKTSLSENLNTLGCPSFTTNSPPTNANYTPSASCPNWIYDVWYEVTVKLSAFGAAGFGKPVIADVHASPSKTGSNTEEVVPGPCPVATAQGGSACVGGTITLQGTAAPNGATFKWTGPNGYTSTQLSPVLSNVTAANAGIYTLTVTFNQLSDIDTAKVTVFPKPNAGIDKSLACADPSTGALQTTTTLTGFSPVGGIWSVQPGNPASATVNNAGSVSGMTVAGIYRFIYSVNNCTDTVAVTVQPCLGCVKPNAGNDQSVCEPVSTVSLTGFSPAGGTWSAQGGNPASATVTNAGVVSGMTINGTYRFIYSVTQGGQTCSDTVNVVRRPKPNAGPDVSICAPLTTAKLTAVTAGGSWTPIASPANPSAASIDASGNVSGMTAVGTYRFVYSVTSGGQTCTDTASVVRNAKPVAGPDQTLACANPTTNTLTTSTTLAPSPAGGSFAQLGNQPAAATVNGNAVSGMTVAGTYRFVYTVKRLHGHGLGGGAALPGLREAQRGPRRFDLRPYHDGQADGGDGGRQLVSHREPGQPLGGQHRRQRQRERDDGGGHLPLRLLGDQRRADLHRHGTVVRNAKPVAGPDQTLACANPTTNTLTTSTTLAPSPAGGVFAQIGTTPAAATVNGNSVSGMTVAGTYQFVYTLNGCTDTVAVTVAPCQGCVKPNAGTDVSICAPSTTAKLTAVTAGGAWSPIASPANPSAASIDASGNVSGMTAVGTYRFVYSVTSGGQTCTDTASVVRNAKPVAGPDQTLACANPATNTLTTSTTLAPSPAGGVFTQIGTTPAAATVNGNSVSGMSVAGTYQFVYTLNGCTDTVAVTVAPCQGCVKPNAGPDVAICAPTTTAKLTAVTAGGAGLPSRARPTPRRPASTPAAT